MTEKIKSLQLLLHSYFVFWQRTQLGLLGIYIILGSKKKFSELL